MATRRSSVEMMAYALEMDVELLPFAGELLADLDELGSDVDLIVEVLADLGVGPASFVVDLGCGKGAVSIAIATRLGCSVVGIDLHEGLIADAIDAARSSGVSDRCRFVVGDVVELAGALAPADAVVFAALGDVLGPLDVTIGIIRRHVRPGGHIVVNDSFVVDAAAARVDGFEHTGTLAETRARLTAHGDELVRETLETPDDDDDEDDEDEAGLVAARAHALAEQRPELAAALQRFVDSQRDEYDFLADATRGAVWALRRRG